MTDRGTTLDRAIESLERAEAALARNRGNMTELDWRAQVDRQTARVMALIHEGTEGT